MLALGARFYSGLSGPGLKLFDRHRPRDFTETLKNADLDDEVRLTRSNEEVYSVPCANLTPASGSFTAS
jgi:hypothetical protein